MVSSNKTPQVSIGLPVFNGEKYLEKTLNSLLDQKLSNFELIISDNNSNDNTANICKNYSNQDKRIKYYKQENNKGFWYNYKFVLDKSIGEYFIWVAADDLQNKNMIFEIINSIIKPKGYVQSIR